MWIWAELGIPRTTDGKLIRRAYATRLRAIDPNDLRPREALDLLYELHELAAAPDAHH